MGPSVRRANEGDAETIASIHVRAWRAAYRGIVPDAYLDGLSIEDFAERHRGRILVPQPGVEVWTADADGTVAGFTVLGPARGPVGGEGEGEVYAIYVDPERVRRGIGRVLLEHAVGELRDRGHRLATLWVLRDNDSGRAFYEAMGWRRDGATQEFELPNFGRVTLHEVRYVRALE